MFVSLVLGKRDNCRYVDAAQVPPHNPLNPFIDYVSMLIYCFFVICYCTGEGYASEGYIDTDLGRTRFPSPEIQNATLRLNTSETPTVSLNGTWPYSYVTVPSQGLSEFITFRGQNFGNDYNFVEVTYGNMNTSSITSSIVCAFSSDPAVIDGPTGSVDHSEVVCRTQEFEPGSTYVLTINVGGQVSDPGVDLLIFPDVPSISEVRGCPLTIDTIEEGTFGCGTSGGDTITVTGSNFGVAEAMEVDVDDRGCTNILVVDASKLTCDLPSGTGELVSITIRLHVSEEEYLQSARAYLLGIIYTFLTHSLTRLV